MSRIKTAVEQSLTSMTVEGQTVTSCFVFPPEFIGFEGHFPAKSVLPGACQIQCVLTTIEKANEKTAALKGIVLAKYFTPVFPGEALTCAVSSLADEDADHIVKALLTKSGAKVAELKLRVSLKSGKRKHRHS